MKKLREWAAVPEKIITMPIYCYSDAKGAVLLSLRQVVHIATTTLNSVVCAVDFPCFVSSIDMKQ
jgi:hypothetical protein